ncbi:uncharacterized protein LOC123534924 [Mercenaria mercenaria]|uniref:uncharacterized protein LOC123534924 n=1 Tax=Mercenaria mercenaria TaxID=6596 RepID=UPI00234F0DCE|nr:uncharacterized protein LOC123534924 [Mercenaria mercenaria]
MARTLLLKLFCLLVILSMLDSAEARRRKKERSGHAKLSRRSKTERLLDLKVGNRKRFLRLKKRQLRRVNKRLSRKKLDVGYFSSSDETVGCLEECINELTNQNCTSRCLEQMHNGFNYVKDNKAITVENNEDKLLVMDTNILLDTKLAQHEKKVLKNGRGKGRGKKTRKRTVFVPNMVDIQNSTGVIKLRLMLDSSCMKIFVDFCNGDIQAAKDEVEYFFALAMNRIALYYSSLKRHGITVNATNNVTFPLDLTVVLENITYPSYNETTKSFHDILPIAFNRRGDGENTSLVMNYLLHPNGTQIRSHGLFTDFASYMRKTFEDPLSFDILHIITGDDLVAEKYFLHNSRPWFFERDSSVSGIADVGSFCSDYQSFTFDGRFGIVEFFTPYFDRIVAHELGHNLGARHDGNERCPTSDFTLMMPAALPKVKNVSAEYYNFSICSAEEIANHLSSFTSDKIATCLYTEKPSVDDFLDNYCKGLTGSKYDLNDHCKLFFGNESYVCTEGNTDLEQGYLAHNSCQPVLDAFYLTAPLFKCAKNNKCENTTNMIFHVFDGSKCLNQDGTQGDQVCFNGECTSEFRLCSKISTGGRKGKRTKNGKKGKRRNKTEKIVKTKQKIVETKKKIVNTRKTNRKIVKSKQKIVKTKTKLQTDKIRKEITGPKRSNRRRSD